MTAPWAVGHTLWGESARAARATELERSNYDLSKPVPPTSRAVGAVKPRPMAWGRAHPALAHNTTTPSAHCAARAPWRSTGSARRESAQVARHGTESSAQDLPKPVPPTYRGAGAVEPLFGGAGRSAPCVGPQHNHANCALPCACSVGCRPKLHGAESARAARHGTCEQRPRHSKACAADLSWCWCSQASAGGLAKSAPRLGTQHNNARSALRGACSVDGRPILSTRRRVRGPGAMGPVRGVHEVSKPVPPTSRGVGALEPWPMAWGRAHPALAHNTTTPSAHCAERAPWWSTGSARRKSAQVACHGTRKRWLKNVRSQCRQPAAVLVQ